VLSGATAAAQGVATPGDVEPPLEIVVPDPSEELPLPDAQPVVVSPIAPSAARDGQLRPGMFVTSAELYPRVRIEDADDVHPRAVPAIVAVMAPHRGARASGALVFVKVLAPPQPPRSVKVKHDEIELDWGDYEINIEAEDGVVEIEYED
jgi:hypothetical protein